MQEMNNQQAFDFIKNNPEKAIRRLDWGPEDFISINTVDESEYIDESGETGDLVSIGFSDATKRGWQEVEIDLVEEIEEEEGEEEEFEPKQGLAALVELVGEPPKGRGRNGRICDSRVSDIRDMLHYGFSFAQITRVTKTPYQTIAKIRDKKAPYDY